MPNDVDFSLASQLMKSWRVTCLKYDSGTFRRYSCEDSVFTVHLNQYQVPGSCYGTYQLSRSRLQVTGLSASTPGNAVQLEAAVYHLTMLEP